MINPSRLYLIPGLAGSQLFSDPGLANIVWVDVGILATGGMRLLWLDSDGLTPLPGKGVELYPGGVLGIIYGAPWGTVVSDQRLAGWTPIFWGYDWRLDVKIKGERLGLDILTHVASGSPCTLVGHSNGGAVARYAWSWLKGMGRENLVRRIITIGTPHQGSYETIAAFDSLLDWVNQIVGYQQATFAFLSSGYTPFPVAPYTAEEIAALCASWPSFYNLLPNPFGTAFASDPFLPSVFQSGAYPLFTNANQTFLDYAYNVLLPAAVDPANIPPPWILTTIGGQGWPTNAGLNRRVLTGNSRDLYRDTNGDGTVPLASALVPGSKQWTFQSMHVDLVAASAAAGFLVEEILDPRDPPTPAPPPQVQPFVTPFTQGMPPLSPFIPTSTAAGPSIFKSGPDP
jgi:pimeloyl-ACP methyl ester carboxylesterase